MQIVIRSVKGSVLGGKEIQKKYDIQVVPGANRKESEKAPRGGCVRRGFQERREQGFAEAHGSNIVGGGQLMEDELAEKKNGLPISQRNW